MGKRGEKHPEKVKKGIFREAVRKPIEYSGNQREEMNYKKKSVRRKKKI